MEIVKSQINSNNCVVYLSHNKQTIIISVKTGLGKKKIIKQAWKEYNRVNKKEEKMETDYNLLAELFTHGRTLSGNEVLAEDVKYVLENIYNGELKILPNFKIALSGKTNLWSEVQEKCRRIRDERIKKQVGENLKTLCKKMLETGYLDEKIAWEAVKRCANMGRKVKEGYKLLEGFNFPDE